ncbi:hypothetical protein SAMN05216466_10151 [Paraburkholderia phenazinium]|uniref:Uncharacterized protein n=2 Tax=Paraburkholderia phenazinium TaxID=60549 RepID=A0A1G7NXB8_9BURK|nr:hypothetical protein [Paraburkholderia phenazinium]SDF78009.1 hypothetical protein SAMN05216466_10151 [Paraburkholderia phenazinium]
MEERAGNRGIAAAGGQKRLEFMNFMNYDERMAKRNYPSTGNRSIPGKAATASSTKDGRHAHSIPLERMERYDPGLVVHTQDDVYRLALRTVQLLGAAPEQRVVDYLKAAFNTVSTGNVPSPDADTAPNENPNAVTSTPDPLAAARARGRRSALEEYESPDNLTLLDARDYAGRNDRTINEQRQRGELYALLPPGKTRGFRYPKWQFDVDPHNLASVLCPFVEARANAWVIHSFMRRKRDELGGKSPADVMLDERSSIAPVVDLAVRDLCGEQGAA